MLHVLQDDGLSWPPPTPKPTPGEGGNGRGAALNKQKLKKHSQIQRVYFVWFLVSGVFFSFFPRRKRITRKDILGTIKKI